MLCHNYHRHRHHPQPRLHPILIHIFISINTTLSFPLYSVGILPRSAHAMNFFQDHVCLAVFLSSSTMTITTQHTMSYLYFLPRLSVKQHVHRLGVVQLFLFAVLGRDLQNHQICLRGIGSVQTIKSPNPHFPAEIHSQLITGSVSQRQRVNPNLA